MLTRELNLKETTPTTLDALVTTFGRETGSPRSSQMHKGADGRRRQQARKIPASDSVAAWANQTGVNVMAAEGLHAKLRPVV